MSSTVLRRVIYIISHAFWLSRESISGVWRPPTTAHGADGGWPTIFQINPFFLLLILIIIVVINLCHLDTIIYTITIVVVAIKVFKFFFLFFVFCTVVYSPAVLRRRTPRARDIPSSCWCCRPMLYRRPQPRLPVACPSMIYVAPGIGTAGER